MLPVCLQVINLKTISQDKKLTSVVQKVALQMNCKLGGELWAAAMPKDLKVNKKKNNPQRTTFFMNKLTSFLF